jgi:hypothetical protein
MFSGIHNEGRIMGFDKTSGNTSGCIKFGMKSSIAITSIDEFAQFLKSYNATTYIDPYQSTIIEIGKSGPEMVKTAGNITVDEEKVEIILHHSSFNYGIDSDTENVIINLNGNEKKIPITFFSKIQLAIAFD